MRTTSARRSRAARTRAEAGAVVVALVLVTAFGGLLGGPADAMGARLAASAASSPDSGWFVAIGRGLQGRTPSPAVQAVWSKRLAGGTTRAVLAEQVVRDDFAYDRRIHASYAAIVGRPPSLDWESTWLARLQAGVQENEFIIGLYGSAELYGRVGGTSAAIVDHLYRAILGRPPSPHYRAQSIRALDTGGTRSDLAKRLWRSLEGAGRRADAVYLTVLGRPPTAGYRQQWASRLRLADDRMLAAAIASSGEYYRAAPQRNARLHLDDGPLTVGTAGRPYRSTLAAVGGTAPYTYEATGLPAGLVLAGGAVTGTPTGPSSSLVTVTARDTTGRSVTRRLALTITPAEVPQRDEFDASSGIASKVLTPDGRDSYRYQLTNRSLTVSALSTNRSANLRAVVVPNGATAQASSTSCATWSAASANNLQQGAALQVRVGADDRVRALVVTKNVWWNGFWGFNLHTFDTARRGDAFVKFGSFLLHRTFKDGDAPIPLPWRLCARAEAGHLEFKAWPTSQAEPAWGDPAYGGRARIPTGWSTTGATGWFIGHLAPGWSSRYDELGIWLPDPAGTSGPAPAAQLPPPDARLGAGPGGLSVYDAG